ncbi:MAG: hypothetical protein ABUT20_06690 [Bacteroidota bacterium]
MKKRISFFLFPFLLSGFAKAQVDSTTALKQVRSKLEKGQATVSDILSNLSFDFIRSKTEFRKLIQQYTSSHSINITTSTEPGTKIIVKGKIIDPSGNPLQKTLVYVYQTNSKGWYGSDRPHFLEREGDRNHARLFGYLITSDKGEFEIKTIQPQGYPQSDLPAHIHFEVFDANKKALKITELLFDDDERLKGDIRQRAEHEGFIISKPQLISGSKIFNYTVSL